MSVATKLTDQLLSVRTGEVIGECPGTDLIHAGVPLRIDADDVINVEESRVAFEQNHLVR